MTTDASRSTTADCYSSGERGWMLRTQEMRAELLAPLLRVLSRLHVSPDHLTLLSLASGLAACPLFFVSEWAALFALAAHVVLDGVDGPLARYLGVASRRGSFTDTLADQAVVTATTVTLVQAGLVGLVSGVAYVYLYAVVVAFAMVRNAMHVPYSWLFRPRFLVYAWIPVELIWLPGSLDVLVWGCVGLLGLKTLSGFARLRARL